MKIRQFVIVSLLFGAIMAVCILLSTPSHASTLSESVGFAAGANAVWLDGPGAGFPVDLEAAGTAKASLSPHLSAVAGLAYGFSHSYIRWDAGFRATATDVDNPNFNLYLGIRYRGGSITAVQPSEWAPDAGLGWKPWPEALPNIVIGADASYGLDSARSQAYLAVRYLLPSTLLK